MSMDITTEDILSKSQVFILRHATTDINLLTQRLVESKAPWEQYIKEGFDVKYRDWGLAEVGVEECEKVSDLAKGMPIHTVFVSPLIRSLQTAYHLLKDHPNFSSMKFVIVPKLREEFISTDDIEKKSYWDLCNFNKLCILYF